MDTPLGKLELTAKNNQLTSCRFSTNLNISPNNTSNAFLANVKNQLDEYFSGNRKTFNIAISPSGTPFQQSVWQALQTIPYGETKSYKDIAKSISHPQAYRAVGMANNKNPIVIIIPCHRVIGSSGKLVGYAGGLELKQQLLELEKKYK